MEAIKMNVNSSSFLLPLSHDSNYELSYIIANKDNIIKCVDAYKKWLENPLEDMPPTPDMTDFQQKTGIIGIPFNLHDVDLYILDRKVQVTVELTI